VDDTPGVTVSATTPMPLQLDGDYLGTCTAADFASVPAVLRVVAPKLG
jgi:diacylglycerol kinase family enzyme